MGKKHMWKEWYILSRYWEKLWNSEIILLYNKCNRKESVMKWHIRGNSMAQYIIHQNNEREEKECMAGNLLCKENI